MNQTQFIPDTVEFHVQAPEARMVCLVIETEDGATTWLPMTSDGAGGWTRTHQMPPEGLRLRYFTQENQTWFNCGANGLNARPTQVLPLAPVA